MRLIYLRAVSFWNDTLFIGTGKNSLSFTRATCYNWVFSLEKYMAEGAIKQFSLADRFVFGFFFFSFSNTSTYTWEFLKPFSLCCNIMYFDMLRHLALINKDQTTVLRNYWRLQIKSNTGSFKPSFIALVLTTMDHKWLQDFRASLILVFIYSVHIPAKFRCNISKLIPEIFFSSFHL